MSRGVATDRRASRLTQPVRQFLETETASGIVLLAAVLVALAWANSPWSASYRALWSMKLSVSLGGFELVEDLRHWINDGLMAVFFFVVGVEIKRELVLGDLSTARRAFLPAAAALGGMVLPAGLYLLVNGSGEAARGWGIPMATDIAFALGALVLVRGIPQQLRIMLLSLAIVDDIGAIIVIALFYVGALHVEALFVALALLGVMALLRVLHVWWMPLYVMVGAGVWLATLESGVHATIAGVVLGLLAPPHPLRAYDMGSLLPRTDEERAGFGAAEARMTRYKVAASIPVTDRLLEILHPWAGFAILPLFALANAGVDLGLDELGSALGGSVAQGVALGLVVGKTGGILAASWLAVKLGARLPAGVTWRHMLGLSVIAGIGFTVSLFITGLAFSHATLVGQAKVGILFGSLVAALAGIAILRTGPRAEGGDAEAPEDGSE